MPTLPPKLDAEAFSARLREAMERAGKGGRGAGARLAKRLGVKPPTAHAWLAGKHMPEPAKVRLMASDYGVDYNWLYFGSSEPSSRIADEAAPYMAGISREEATMLADFRLCSDDVRSSLATLARAAAKRAA